VIKDVCKVKEQCNNAQEQGRLAQAQAAELRGHLQGPLEELLEAKRLAVEMEDFDEAKRLKQLIDQVGPGAKVRELQEAKKAAIAREDYDTAKILKGKIEAHSAIEDPPRQGWLQELVGDAMACMPWSGTPGNVTYVTAEQPEHTKADLSAAIASADAQLDTSDAKSSKDIAFQQQKLDKPKTTADQERANAKQLLEDAENLRNEAPTREKETTGEADKRIQRLLEIRERAAHAVDKGDIRCIELDECARAQLHTVLETRDIRNRVHLIASLSKKMAEHVDMDADLKKDMEAILEAAVPEGVERSDEQKVLEAGYLWASRAQDMYERL